MGTLQVTPITVSGLQLLIANQTLDIDLNQTGLIFMMSDKFFLFPYLLFSWYFLLFEFLVELMNQFLESLLHILGILIRLY